MWSGTGIIWVKNGEEVIGDGTGEDNWPKHIDISHWFGTFGDTNHPGCPRHISAAEDYVSYPVAVSVTGHDGLEAGIGSEAEHWQATGTLFSEKKIVVDLSSKGGPAALEVGQGQGCSVEQTVLHVHELITRIIWHICVPTNLHMLPLTYHTHCDV